jgi:predicted Zn-dependent protease
MSSLRTTWRLYSLISKLMRRIWNGRFLLSRDFEKEAPHPLFLDTLGWVRLKMGHLDDAVRLMRQAIAKAPDLPMLNYHLGAALYQSGRNIEAKVYLAKALKSTEAFQGRREAERLLAQTSG